MLIALITLAMAIAILSISPKVHDEINRLLTLLTGWCCLLLSLCFDPCLLKLLIGVAILLPSNNPLGGNSNHHHHLNPLNLK
jgi:hypothetical protein